MSEGKSPLRTARALIIGLAAVIVVLGAALIIMAIGRSGTQVPLEQINVLADSNDPCVVCHRRTTPGIVEQYSHSRMAAANVSCQQCHVVQSNYPSAEEHQGVYILRSPTTAICQNCHGVEVAQFYQSRHSLPAYVAFAGSKDLSPQLLAMYQAIPEGTFNPDSSRNAIAELEGPDMTPFTCANCHSIGAPAADGSVGECQKCHLRHEFSREQARKPETCNACHIGPDHPQYEIYTESPHGIAYHTLGQNWHWEAAPGTLTVNDFPAPTCAICHMSGFGPSGTTHDVGDRLTWFLFAPISQRRPNWQDNMVRMQGVCMACHNKNFIDDFYTAADTATERVNSWVQQSDAMIAPLKDKGLLTAAPFDEPIDYTYFELWHHWGRTAKFGTWMQGPDYAQWHGAYEVLKALVELKTEIDEKLAAPAAGTGQ
jgi:hydroxylamine dehydrogenase